MSLLRTPVVWYMSLAAALGTATIYPLQPAIADVAGSLDASLAAVGVALACGPVGYLCGLALLVPLVDRFPPRNVLSAQFGALAAALALGAAVDRVWLLGLIVGAIGACSSVGAGLSSVGSRLASASRRATVLGIITAGISAGILAGRIVGGWLADAIGWRGMLVVFAGASAAIAATMLLAIPAVAGATGRGYLATLRSILASTSASALYAWQQYAARCGSSPSAPSGPVWQPRSRSLRTPTRPNASASTPSPGSWGSSPPGSPGHGPIGWAAER
jgi:MFS family permease